MSRQTDTQAESTAYPQTLPLVKAEEDNLASQRNMETSNQCELTVSSQGGQLDTQQPHSMEKKFAQFKQTFSKELHHRLLGQLSQIVKAEVRLKFEETVALPINNSQSWSATVLGLESKILNDQTSDQATIQETSSERLETLQRRISQLTAQLSKRQIPAKLQSEAVSLQSVMGMARQELLSISTDHFVKLANYFDEKCENAFKNSSEEFEERIRKLEDLVKEKAGKTQSAWEVAINQLGENSERHSKSIQSIQKDLLPLRNQLQRTVSSLNFLVARTETLEKQREQLLSQVQEVMQENMTEFKEGVQEYLSEMVQQNNNNFQTLHTTQATHGEFNHQILSVVKKLYAKIGQICNSHKSIKQNLKQIQEFGAGSNKEIRQFDSKLKELAEKEFELEHELRSAKIKLEGVEDILGDQKQIHSTGASLEASLLKLDQQCPSIDQYSSDPRDWRRKQDFNIFLQ